MLLRRSKSPDPQPDAQAVADELARKLATEVRTCLTCGYSVGNPMTDRCPRCFAMIALSEHTNCGDCSHQGACEFQKLHAMGQK